MNVVVAVIVNVTAIHVKARRDRRECCNAVESIAGGHIVLSFQTQPAVRRYIFIRPQFGRIGCIAIDGCQRDCRSEERISDLCHCNRHLISIFGCAIFVRNLAAVGLFANIGRWGGIIISCFTGNRVPSAAILDLPLIVHTMTHCLDKQACGRVLLYGQIARLICNGQPRGVDRYGEVVAGDGHIAACGFEPALIAACISKSERSGETVRRGGRNRCGCLDRFRAVLFRNQLIGDGLAAVASHCLGIERQRAIPDGIGPVSFINAIPLESRNSRSLHNKGQSGTVLCNSRVANNSVIIVGVIAEEQCACRSRELIVLCGLQYDFAIVFRSCNEGACRFSAAIVRIPVDAVHGIAAADSRSAGSGSSGFQRRAQLNGGTGNLRYHRCFVHHQLDDMLVAENADGAAVLIQIQLQIIGIDLWVCARRNGDRMRGFIGSDGICLLYCSRTGDIMLARGSIGIARIYQFTRQRIPLELESMRLVVVHILNGALPVLEVVDLFAIQRDGLHAPCVGDDRGRLVIHSLDNKGISSRIVFRFPVIGNVLVVAVVILRRKSAVARLDGVLPQQLVGQLIDFVTLQALFHRRGAVQIIPVIFISRESFVEVAAVQLGRHVVRHSPLLFIIHQREFRSQPEFLAEFAAADDHFGRGKAAFKAGSRPCLYLSEEGAAFDLGERHFTVARCAACAVEHDILFKGAAGDDDARGRFIPLAIAGIHTHRPLEGTAVDGHFGVIICNQRVATGAVVQIIKLVKELGRVCVAVFVCLRRNIERTSVDDNLSAIMAIDSPSPQNTSE